MVTAIDLRVKRRIAEGAAGGRSDSRDDPHAIKAVSDKSKELLLPPQLPDVVEGFDSCLPPGFGFDSSDFLDEPPDSFFCCRLYESDR